MVDQVDPNEAERRAARGAVLLDVREQVEWDAGRAPDAVHLPMSQIQRRLGDLDPDEEYVLVCKSGGRSNQVGAWLGPQGFEVSNLAGGMLAWRESGRRIVTDDGDDGVVLLR